MNHLFIVTHTDLDGVGSAAVYIRLSKVEKGFYTILYAEPYNIDSVLDGIKDDVDRGDRLVIADLGPNREAFGPAVEILAELVKRGVEVEWYDHHIWSPEEEAALKDIGVRVYVDTNTCATGVVARYYSRERGVEIDEITGKIVHAVCAADLWRWDDPLAPKLFRVAGNRHADEWKTKLAEKLASGTLWDDELQVLLEDYVNKELAGMERVLRTLTLHGRRGECTVAATVKGEGPPSNSFIGALLLSRYQADIAVIVRSNGALSLRSRGVDVQAIAKRLGGGGHPRAAGAKVEIPFIYRLLSLFTVKAISWYVGRLVLREARRLGACDSGELT